MQRSPYTPGETTDFLPGRDRNLFRLKDTADRLADTGAFIARPKVYIGGRGIGKTSLLRSAQKDAHHRGLQTIWITAGDSPLIPTLSAELSALTAGWDAATRQEISGLIRNLQLTLKIPGLGSVTTSPAAGEAPHIAPGKALEQLIGTTAARLRRTGEKGLIIFIDELQSADLESLRALAYAWQHLRSWTQPEVPAALVAAGLGHTPDVITDAATFGERFDFRRLESLEREAAYAAVFEPAEKLGVRWEYDALHEVLTRSRGYPTFIQVYSDAAWEAAGNPDPGGTIGRQAVADSEEEVTRYLELFYRSRWNKATPAERELLRAIAMQPEALPRRKDVAQAMGKSSTAISMARRSLMDKGILDSPRRGILGFTAPGFENYILEHEGLDD